MDFDQKSIIFIVFDLFLLVKTEVMNFRDIC